MAARKADGSMTVAQVVDWLETEAAETASTLTELGSMSREAAWARIQHLLRLAQHVKRAGLEATLYRNAKLNDAAGLSNTA
jgi:hypothetical protein